MRTRGTRSGISLSFDAQDSAETLPAALEEQRELLSGKVFIEVSERTPFSHIEAVMNFVREVGGEMVEIRPPNVVMSARGETVIVAKTVRGGGRVESTGSVIVLGDVNAGAEIVAEDDIIVVGTLRGLAHAGAGGNERAIIWAQSILSPQLRIGSALAQAGDGGDKTEGAEVAHLVDGQIMLRPWSAKPV